ncbi:MAG: hypothetical protein QME16_07150 [Planctomycetota bacterium]|nr:hypothetical protein [Planctomycetota bacterium]
MSGEKKRIGLVQIKVNGKFIPLKGFVQGFIGSTILGMLKGLKDVPEPEEPVRIMVEVNPAE